QLSRNSSPSVGILCNLSCDWLLFKHVFNIRLEEPNEHWSTSRASTAPATAQSRASAGRRRKRRAQRIAGRRQQAVPEARLRSRNGAADCRRGGGGRAPALFLLSA